MSLPIGLVIYASVKPIFKIYFIIGAGFFLAKKNIFTVTTCRDISNAVVTVIMPCLIFNNIISNLKSSDIKDIGILFLSGTILIMTGGLLALLTSIVTKSPRRWLGGLISVGLFPNISDLPIAYLQTLSKGDVVFTQEQGNKGVAYVCIFLASQILYQFSCGLYKLVQWDFREGPITDEEKQLQSTETEKDKEDDDDDDCENDVPIHSESSSVSVRTNNTRENEQHEAFLMARSDSNRSRRGSNARSINIGSLSLTRTRSTDMRKQKPEDISHLIHEYSEFDNMKKIEKMPSGVIDTSAAPVMPSVSSDKESTENEPEPPTRGSKFKAHLIQTAKNFRTPNSMSLICSIIIAMAPPLRALFVETSNFHIHPAPDRQPPLSFVMDLASYIGNASVPLGLMLLGATISRLKVKSMPKGFWKTVLMITACRLVLLPMIGVGYSTGLYKAGWYDDIIIRFVSVLQFGLPSATALVYFTAFYTDPQAEEHVQMDCLAVCLIAQYAILWISLPFLVTFTFKVSMGL